MRWVALAGQVLEHSELVRLGRAYVALAHERTGAAAHVMAPSYESVACIAHAAGYAHEPPRVRELVPAHATAAGKALLASRARWRESVLEIDLPRYTERTIVEPAVLRTHLDAVLSEGYAVEDGEYQEGVCAVAAPVFSAGEAVAALSLSGPGLRSDDVLADVLDIAARLTEELGRG
jgi:DNA-binding IclR family transcriptional regulator